MNEKLNTNDNISPEELRRENYRAKYKRSKYIFILFGLFWTVMGVVEFFNDSPRIIYLIYLIGGPLLIIQSIISIKKRTEL